MCKETYDICIKENGLNESGNCEKRIQSKKLSTKRREVL